MGCGNCGLPKLHGERQKHKKHCILNPKVRNRQKLESEAISIIKGFQPDNGRLAKIVEILNGSE